MRSFDKAQLSHWQILLFHCASHVPSKGSSAEQSKADVLKVDAPVFP